MAERPAVDTSPLILFARTDLLALLRLAGEELVVPRAVAQEVARGGRDDVAVRALRETSWLTIVRTPRTPAEVRACRLHRGESAVLTWARRHPGTTAILDDRSARRCAVALAIPLRGTLGLVLAAKQRGTIPLARPLVERLVAAGYYLSSQTMNEALALVGE